MQQNQLDSIGMHRKPWLNYARVRNVKMNMMTAVMVSDFYFNIFKTIEIDHFLISLFYRRPSIGTNHPNSFVVHIFWSFIHKKIIISLEVLQLKTVQKLAASASEILIQYIFEFLFT